VDNKTTTNTVTINGKLYDSISGLAMESKAEPERVAKKPVPATAIHNLIQKSQTLNRRVTKKPILHSANQLTRKVGRSMDIARSRSIARFAPHPVVTPQPIKKISHDIAPTKHPVVTKAAVKQTAKNVSAATSSPTHKSPQIIKQEAISVALATPKAKKAKKSFFKRRPRRFAIIVLSVVTLVLASYVFYLTMPSLSVKVASAQAGISASYPQYIPDGYRINGPVTYSDGQVTINFTANTGNKSFAIQQIESSWDSSAVLNNVVRKKVGEKYLVTQENGLTIFTYSGNGAWANAGIMYTITGDSPLTSDQIRHIATSM